MIHARELMTLHALAQAGGALHSNALRDALPPAMRINKTTEFYRALADNGLIIRIGNDTPVGRATPATQPPSSLMRFAITSAGRAALVNNAPLLDWHLANPSPDPSRESADVGARWMTDLAAHVAGKAKFSVRPLADASGWNAANAKAAIVRAVAMELVESAPRTAEDACVAWFRLRPARFVTSIAAPRVVEWQNAKPGDLPHVQAPVRPGAADFLRCGTVGVRC